jgi:hypothetical protein
MPTNPHPTILADLPDAAIDLLRGAIDMHVHAAPDPFAQRKMDARETVREAAEAGMGGVVLKSHEYPTQALAWAVGAEAAAAGHAIEVYGAIALDHGVGGLNPDALEAALRMGTRVVWMPTFDTQWSRDTFGRFHSRGAPMRVLDEGGALLPVCHELLELIEEHDALLCSGHLGPDETPALVRAARGRGIRTLITHATAFHIPLEVQQEAASLGACIEQCINAALGEAGDEVLARTLGDVRAVGAEHVVLSTDLGQAHNPPPAVGMGMWIQHALDAGFTSDEVRRMVQANPAELLG